MGSPGFLDVTNPEHAYLFGFLQGDGSLKGGTGRKGRLTIELCVSDIAVLEQFQQLVPFYTSIRTRTRTTNFAEEYTSVIWSLYAFEAREWLMELGLPVGRKSEQIGPPAVPFSDADYLRGLVDADGSVAFTSRGSLPFISLTTASAAIKDYFIQSCPKEIGRPRKSQRNRRDDMFNVMAMQEAAVGLASVLYYKGSLALDRKARAAHLVQAWKRPAGMKIMSPRPWDAAQDEIAVNHCVEEAARLLDRSERSVSLRRWRIRWERQIVSRALALRDSRLFYEPL
jgi:hypothetical protein